MPTLDRVTTAVMFSPDGLKAAFVTKQAAVYEVTISSGSISHTMTPRIVRAYKHSLTLSTDYGGGGSGIVNGDIDTYGDSNVSRTLTIARADSASVSLVTLDPVNETTVTAESSSLSWEKPICADYTAAGALIIGLLKFSGAPRFVASPATVVTPFVFSIKDERYSPTDAWWFQTADGSANQPMAAVGGTALLFAANFSRSSYTTTNSALETEARIEVYDGPGDYYSVDYTTTRTDTETTASTQSSLQILFEGNGYSFLITSDQCTSSYSMTLNRDETFVQESTFPKLFGDLPSDYVNGSFSVDNNQTTITSNTQNFTTSRIRHVDLRTGFLAVDRVVVERSYTETQYSETVGSGSNSVTGTSYTLFGQKTTNANVTGSSEELVTEQFQCYLGGVLSATDSRVVSTQSDSYNIDADPEVVDVYSAIVTRPSTYNRAVSIRDYTPPTDTSNAGTYQAPVEYPTWAGRVSDEAVNAYYAAQAVFFSGRRWENSSQWSNPLMLDGALRNAEEIFEVSTYTNPRFRSLRSF